MKALAIHIWRMTVFQATPDKTPYSPPLMVTLGFLFMCFLYFQWMVIGENLPFQQQWMSMVALSVVLTDLLYTYVVLRVVHLTPRWVQTITSLWAVQLVIHLLSLPLIAATMQIKAASQSGVTEMSGFVAAIYFLLALVLTIWQFLITAFIYQSALNTSFRRGVLLCLGYVAVNILTVNLWR